MRILRGSGRRCWRTSSVCSRNLLCCSVAPTAWPAIRWPTLSCRQPVTRAPPVSCASWPTGSARDVSSRWVVAATIGLIWLQPGLAWSNRSFCRAGQAPEIEAALKPPPAVRVQSAACFSIRIAQPLRTHSVQGSSCMYPTRMLIADFDPALQRALDGERVRQEEHIELIASENYASPRVLQAQGSVLTNKYAEGYPGKRYYGGCEFVDIAEQLAIDRAKQLFGADYANVQPHSGSQANAAVYLALVAPGETILGMSLDHGGHLTHGAKVNFSGKLFNA